MTRPVSKLEFTGERVIPDLPGISELFREHVARYLFARQFCTGRTVLDAGCGTGYGTDLLRQAGAIQAIGIDISLEAIAYAHQRYSSSPVTAQFLVADCTNLPFADRSFDVLVSFETIEHLQNPRAFMSEVDRVLMPEGLLVISTPNRATYPQGNPFHVREYDEAEFTSFLQEFFPYVDVWYQDLGTVHRVLPGHGVLPGAGSAPGQQCLDLRAGASANPAYFIALCARVPLASWVPAPVFMTSERDLAVELTRAQTWALERDAETDRLGEIIRSLQDQVQVLEATVDERTRWAQDRDAEVQRLGEIIRSLQDQVQVLEATVGERTRWAQERDAEVQRLEDTIRTMQDQIRSLQDTVEERTCWALERDAETVRLGEIIRSLQGELRSAESALADARAREQARETKLRAITHTGWVRLGRTLRLIPQTADQDDT